MFGWAGAYGPGPTQPPKRVGRGVWGEDRDLRSLALPPQPSLNMLKLIWRNTIRHPLRASLTVTGMAVAVLAFCLLRTVVAAWYAGVSAASPVRLVTRNAISLIFRLPLAYQPKIQALPGITGLAYGQWFGGIYIDEKHFFPQFAVSLSRYLDLYPEYLIPLDQKLALLQDRRGCVAGRQLAKRYGWRLGDSIILKGTIYPGEYRLILRAVYSGRDPTIDEGRLLFHWEYVNETMIKNFPARADQVSWFLTRVASPELAAPLAAQIDALFKNSLAETLTESEAAFALGFVSMTEAILLAIQVVSWVVIGVLLFLLGATCCYLAFDHVQRRVKIWADPLNPSTVTGDSYQPAQSLFAIASGGIAGTGLGRGQPGYIDPNFVTDRRSVQFVATDFIFAALCEELGLLGAVSLLLLFLMLAWRGLRIGTESGDAFLGLLAVGLCTILFLQCFVIVGGVTRLIPLTGITLPFVSYGGSSILTNFLLAGLLLAISGNGRAEEAKPLV